MELIPIVAGGLLVVGFLMMVVAAVMLIARRGKKSGTQPQAVPKAPSRGPGRPPAPPPRGAQPPAPHAPPPPPPTAMPAAPPAMAAPPPPPPAAAPVMAPPPPPPAPAPVMQPPPPPAEPEFGHTVAMDPSEFMPATLAQPRPGYYGRFVGVKGVLEGSEVPIDEAGFFIGRDHTLAQLVISDPRVSKKHCWIGVRGGEIWAIDQGSTNGTYVNDVSAGRITERRLNRGDVVIVSEDVSRFEFRLD